MTPDIEYMRSTALDNKRSGPTRAPIIVRSAGDGNIEYAMGAPYLQCDGLEGSLSLDGVPYLTYSVGAVARTDEELEDGPYKLLVLKSFTDTLLKLTEGPEFRYFEWRLRPLLSTGDAGMDITIVNPDGTTRKGTEAARKIQVRARFVVHTTKGVIAPELESVHHLEMANLKWPVNAFA